MESKPPADDEPSVEVVNEPEVEETQANTGTWSGWFASVGVPADVVAAATMVSGAGYDLGVKASRTAAQLATNLVEVMDPDTDEETIDATELNTTGPTGELAPEEDIIIKTIDSAVETGASVFRSGATLLMQSVNTLKETELGKQAQKVAVQSGRYANESLMKLETTLDNIFSPEQGNVGKTRTAKKPEKASRFNTMFEDSNGTVHLEALESISIQCVLDYQAAVKNATDEEVEQFEHLIKLIQEAYDRDDEEVPDDLPEVETGNKVKAQKARLEQCVSDSTIVANDRLEAFKKDLEEAKASTNSAEDILKVVAAHQKLLSDSCTYRLATMSSLSVELLLRLTEYFRANRPKKEKVMDYATFLVGTAELLSDDITGVSMEFIDAISYIPTAVEAYIDADQRKVLEDKTTAINGVIYVEAGCSITHVQAAKKATQQLCKLLLVSTEEAAIEQAPVEKKDVTQEVSEQ